MWDFTVLIRAHSTARIIILIQDLVLRLHTAIDIEVTKDCCLGNPSSDEGNDCHEQNSCDSPLRPEDEVVGASEQVDVIPSEAQLGLGFN